MPIRQILLLDKQKVEPVDPVEQASTWATKMTKWEASGPGDLPRAMTRLERRYGLPSNTFWSLRYRKPKDIFTKVYLKLAAAYEAERQRQLRLLEHEQTIAIAAGASAAVVRAASDLSGVEIPRRR